MDKEESWVNLHIKRGKENDKFYKTNTNKGNEVSCFPLFLSVTPKQKALSTYQFYCFAFNSIQYTYINTANKIIFL